MPSDVVWTAVITGTVGLGGIISTSIASLRLDSRRLAAEDKRLDRQRGEERRTERGAAYYYAITVFSRLDRYATGYPPNDDSELHATLDEYNDAVSALLLFATTNVITALRDLQELSRRVGSAMAEEPPGVSHTDAFIAGWLSHRDKLLDAERQMLLAMRQDIDPPV